MPRKKNDDDDDDDDCVSFSLVTIIMAKKKADRFETNILISHF